MKRQSRRGFSLIEVLLAVLILGLSMSVLLTAMSRCMLLFRTVQNYHKAQGILGRAELDYPLTELARDDDWQPQDFEVSDEAYDEFTFSRRVEDPEALSVDDDEPRLLIVRSIVKWSNRGRTRQEEAVRYVFYAP